MPQGVPVCDYEGSDYRTRFWRGQGREYEDRAERIALRSLLPRWGTTLIDIGAGFGRLANEYTGYSRVVLFDYSRSLLREARERLGKSPRFIYVAGSWYQMPFVDGLFSAMVQVRTMHHAADVPALYAELGRIARPGGNYILEFANKRNLKAIARYVARRQEWSPFTSEPVEFAALNFDFHPRWIDRQLRAAGFHPRRQLTVSHFRLSLLKRLLPTGLLVAADRLLQPTARFWQLTPSVFVASDHPPGGEVAASDAFFACPRCGNPLELPEALLAAAPTAPPDGTKMACPDCDEVWRVRDGIYDFKEPD